MKFVASSTPLLLALAVFGGQGQSPSAGRLDLLMNVPFASSVIAAPTGARIAWLENDRGARNIYVAAAPDWKAKAATSFHEDDGLEIDDLAWSPDANTLYFARGGDFENGGENPNPDLDLKRPDQSVWSVPFSGGEPRKLAEGRLPSPSPKGDVIAFLHKNQVSMMKADGHDVAEAFNTKGTVQNLEWSPDGRFIAFTNLRGDHSFVGLYSPADHALSFPDASSGFDSEPSWSADGSRLAYVHRQEEERWFLPRRSGFPWSIRLYEPGTRSCREVFHADDGPGSVFHGTASLHQLFWAGDRIVFPWEKTGWVHLYSISAAGGGANNARELTPGAGEVEHVALTRDGKTVFYSTNIAPPDSTDVDRRHIAKVDVAGSAAPQAVTSGEGIEWSPEPLADASGIALLASSYNQRAHAAVLEKNGKPTPILTDASAFTQAEKLAVKPQQVILPAADGLPIHGQLFLPGNERGGERHPALIFVHGGSRRQMLLGYHYMYYYSNAYSMNQYLASLGYVVLSINYRSGIGYGLNFREATNFGPSGGSEFQDVIGAGLYLKARPDVDGRRIGIWGGSYGGYLTAMALARASSLFAAGVDFHGVHDWSTLRNFEAKGGNPATLERARQAARLAFDSSPMASVSTWRSPVLLIHGDDDRNVAFSQTVELAAALHGQKVPMEELIFPNEIHDFLLHRHWMEAYKATAGFFDRHFQQAPNTPPSTQ